MTQSARIALHSYLQHCPTPERLALAKYLAPVERQALEKLPKTAGNPLADHETEGSTLRHIHHSWITPFLRTLSEKEVGFFLASLDHSQAIAVGKDLLYTGEFPQLSVAGKKFLQETLLRYLTAEVDDLLPLSFLPQSPLHVLLDLKNETLQLSLDFLGLHDLATEVKQIIEKQKLNKIYDALTPGQLAYLKILAQSQEPVAFTPMGLANWNEDKEKLKLLIRQRGANRMAKAIYGQDPSFVWYLFHKFDVERALTIRKLMAPLDNSRAVQVLTNQIIEFINYSRKSYE